MNHLSYDNAPVYCLLGPTNTGKTFQAVARMLAHHDGVIGFPLRLLARENYDRICALKGKQHCALVTGEERIIPKDARYFCCTVESMPLSRSFEFVGIDEIQLCADAERGHIFTNRLLHARGSRETMMLGADTMRPIIQKLLPDAIIERAERFSELSYSGFKKLSRLPKRSAVIAFSMDEVYKIAEIIRRERGGTAIILGALSPRTRNKQVALYQTGEVDYLVATDAIGMGLNMDIKHIAFAATHKFDGQSRRPLTRAELSQIAGRAGRHVENGSFGVTGNISALSDSEISAIEKHNLPPITQLYWRSQTLDYSSLTALEHSLSAPPPNAFFRHGRISSDQLALRVLMSRSEIQSRAQNEDDLQRLWQVCQIPNFRRQMQEAHINLLQRVFIEIHDYGFISEEWIAGQIEQLDKPKGEIDSLMLRLEAIRTWNYISHQGQWLQDTAVWQVKSQSVENKLSDSLHEALSKRFVDTRSASLIRTLESNKRLYARIENDGKVSVEGHSVGHLQGFRFIPDKTFNKKDQKAIMTAARQALLPEINNRADEICKSLDRQFSLNDEGYVFWQENETNPMPGEAIMTLAKGEHILKPKLSIPQNDLLSAEQREKLLGRAQRWLDDHIRSVLEPLVKLNEDEELIGSVRGIAFQMYESLGLLPRAELEDLIATLEAEDRRALRQRRIMLGPLLVFMPYLNKPAAVRLRALLWGLFNDKTLPMPVPFDGAVSVVVEPKDIDTRFYQAISYPVYGSRAIRIDMLDRVINAIYDSADKGTFRAQHKMCEWLGCKIDELYDILSAMGHKKIEDAPEKPAEDNTAPEAEAENTAQRVEEKTEAEAEAKDASQAEEAKPEEAKPEETKAEKPAATLPELALFRLKKGKAHVKSANKRKFSGKPGKAEQDGSNKKPRKNFKKGKKPHSDKQRVYSAGPTKAAEEDSPFAILAQLKDDKK